MSTKSQNRKDDKDDVTESRSMEQQFQREQRQVLLIKHYMRLEITSRKPLMKQEKKFHVIHKLLTIIRKIQYKLLEKLQTIL